MNEQLDHENWSGRTHGTPFMLRNLVVMFRHIPLWFFHYFIVTWVIMFYMVFNRRGYLSAYRFLRKAFGYSRVKSFFKVYANHLKFGWIIMDRFAKYAGKKFNFTIEGEELFNELASKPESFMMISAHVGNYEMAGYSFKSDDKPLNALVFEHEAETVMKNRGLQFSETNIRMIAMKADMSHLFKINNALRDGEIVSMPGDRVFGSAKTVDVKFFGHTMPLPMGPYATIAQRGIEAISVFVMKSGYKDYSVYVTKITPPHPEGMKRNDYIKLVAQTYADSLERVVRLYPTQWLNYYDIWTD